MDPNKPLALFYLTPRGRLVAEKLANYFPEAQVKKFNPNELARDWETAGALVFIMACGIVVRAIVPLIKSKKTDPAVLVIDEEGTSVISLLSGHLGGANELCREVAAILAAKPVITTASDVSGLPALDLWARENRLTFEPEALIPKVMTRYIQEKTLKVYLDFPVHLPRGFKEVKNLDAADLIVSYRLFPEKKALFARPKVLFLGLGLHEDARAEEIEGAVNEVFTQNGLSFASLAAVATVSKKAAVKGLSEFAQKYGLKLMGITPESLAKECARLGLANSFAANTSLGTPAVAEPAAMFAAGEKARLLIPKTKVAGLTLAVAAKETPFWGKLSIVGTGPGSLSEMTPLARKAIREAAYVVGYKCYLELIAPLLSGKETFTSGMTKEVERAQKAIELARKGAKVALVCGGDPGIYALAGLVFELLAEDGAPPDFEVQVIAGVSALNAGAARLGAPLTHDFAVISLSDRLTSWETIAKRLRAAAEADFVLVLYNPMSRTRKEPLKKAHRLLLNILPGKTPVGLARAISREGETILLTTLEKLLDHEIDMQTTIFIGNSESFCFGPWLITPRGYKGKRF